MNQTNNIERNNLERGQGQNIAVVTRGGLMRNSEPQNLYSSVNPTDDQAGAMTSSPESSSNNISTRNDQRGQGYQSCIETDVDTADIWFNNDLENETDIYDGVVLHAEDDRDAAIEFITNMQRENPDLNMKITLYGNLMLGTSLLGSAAKLFDSCRYLFVFVTHNLVKADIEIFLLESAMIETLTFEEKNARLIPVKTDKTHLSALAPLKSLKYDNYLEAKKSQQGPDQYFIKCFRKLITNGRQKYLVIGDYSQENLKATETNSQKLQESIQKIEKQSQKLREQMGNMNLNKDPQSPMMGTSDEIKVDKELLSKGTYISYENCVYLGGACNVGKSTLASILIGEAIPQHWKSTDGLTIYFGRNGIHLKNKEMVPLKQDFHADVLSKVLCGKPEKPDTTHREEVLPHDSNKGNIIPETHIDTQRTDITAPTPSLDPGTGKDDMNITDPVRQQSPQNYIITTIEKDIKEKIRKGTYKIEIAPSDLVDFGGQRSFDMTHQLFMRRKGTFVLMFNGRIDFSVPLEEYKQGETTESILKHWVNSILSYCAEDDDILPIILFCATHSDGLNEEDYKDRKEKLIHDLGEIFKNHKRQHRIIYDDIFFINGQDKNDLEINKLKSKLVEVACKQKSWGKRMPMACVPLDLQMSELRLHNMSIISKEELITLNKRNEDLALTDEQIKYFLNDQHSLGKIVYFDQHGLDNFINLQPQSLVNILRSFITAECFWPEDKELKGILRALTDTGKIAKEDLLKLWSQKKFHQHMPNDDFKEFIIQVLVHLDILVEPRHYIQEKESKVQSYLVPCIVKRRLPVTDFYVKSAHKMICLSYTLLKSSIPAALSFKLIGAAMNLWPLKKEGICLYHQAAILCIDKSNDLHLLVKDDRVFVYLINKVAKRFIPPSIASTVQECLTFTMTKVLEFYHKSFGKSLSTLDVSKAFEIKVGEWCTSDGGCYISVPELEKETEWRCKNNKLKRHDKTYPRYWICNKKQVKCDEKCPGLDEKFLVLHPEDKHCFRLAKLITLDECYRVVTRLGFSEIALNDIQNEDKYDNTDKKGVALYQWRDQKEKDGSKPSFQELFDALAEKKTHHVLCQLFTEDVTDHEIKNSALQEIPDDDCLQDLSKQVGNCAMHLGAELGLSMPAIEGILFKYRKSIIEQALGVMKEWKSSSKVRPTILMLMKAFQLADGRGLVFLRKKYMGNVAGGKISDDGDGNLQES